MFTGHFPAGLASGGVDALVGTPPEMAPREYGTGAARQFGVSLPATALVAG